MDLRRIKRHHEHWHAGGQQRLRPCRIAQEVPFRVGRPPLALASVVTALDAAAHQHHPLQSAKRRRVACNGLSYVAQGSNRDQRDLVRVLANLVQQKRHAIAVLLLRPAFGISLLRKHILRRRLHPGKDRHIAASHRCQVVVHETSPQVRVAKGRRHAQDPQLRTLQRQRQSECVIDIVPNIGIQNHQLRRDRCGRACRPRTDHPAQHHCQHRP